jgi:hypothetical protein
MPGKWKAQAREIIRQAKAEAFDLGLRDKDLVRYVDKRYPFGPRRCYAYRAWLAARRELLGGIGGVKRLGKPVDLARLDAWNARMRAAIVASWGESDTNVSKVGNDGR